MRNSSKKIQLKLTIEFAIFFAILAGAVYYYFTHKLEIEAHERFKERAQVIANYISNSPNTFWQKKIDNKNFLKDILTFNNALYLVFENASNEVFDGINMDVAESTFYLMDDSKETFSTDQKVYRTSVPVLIRNVDIGKIYIAFNSEQAARKLFTKQLHTGLFSIGILLFGILFTYLLSSISLRPLTRVFQRLDKAIKIKSSESKKENKKDEILSLADRLDIVLHELDKSSSQVEVLNKKVHDFIKSKLNELTEEINHRKKAEYSLIKSEEQFRIMFENAPIGMVMLSPENQVMRVNKSFCKMVGYQPDELINMHIRCLIDRDKMEFFTDENIPKREPGVVDTTSEKVLVRRSGTEISVIVKSVPIFDSQKKVKHYIIQVLDISQIKNIQKELINTLEKAKESDRLKSAFLAQMSHEIRTPLNVILTSVPLLVDEIDNGDEELKIILNSVKSAGKRLQRTIDMILNMSSVQSGNYKPDYENFDIVSDLKNMVNEFRSLAEDKGLQIRFLKHCENVNITADKYTVNQIFQNLINNAIKYTPKGFVEIAVIETYNKIKVEIRDSGIGMSPEYMKNLFSPFSQEDAGHKREYEGNGLGLALVKKYVEINSAIIEVESEKNIGSVFTVTFDKELDLALLNNFGNNKSQITT
jgi:PAS domain S-box-containing protein